MKIRLKSQRIFVIIFFILFSCSQKDKNYSVENLNGVSQITNKSALWGEEPEVELRFVKQIGELDGTDSNYSFHQPNDLAVDDEGNIYVLDSGNCRIQKFDKNGTYLSTMGRRGEGPGEIPGFTFGIDIIENILYFTHSNTIVRKFSTDGKDLGRYIPGGYPMYIRHFNNSELITHCSEGYVGISSYEPEKISLVFVFSEDGKTRKIGSPVFFENAHETKNVNAVLMETDKDNNIFVAFENLNRIDKYTHEGEHLFSVSRPLNYEVLEKPVWTETHSKLSPVPRFTSVSKGIGIDSKNRIWVLTANRIFSDDEWREMRAVTDREGAKPEYEKSLYDFHIFTSEGVFLGSILVPEKWLEFRMRIFKDRLFLIEYEFDVCVKEYRIVEK
ncbi:6-bladed beta-propeller [candidate division KSB1 bacterium]